MTSHALSNAISHTIFATSTDDLRPAMTGVYLQLSADNATFVATDGHRLIRYKRLDIKSETDSTMIIPRKALTLLKTTLHSDNLPVHQYPDGLLEQIKYCNSVYQMRFPIKRDDGSIETIEAYRAEHRDRKSVV